MYLFGNHVTFKLSFFSFFFFFFFFNLSQSLSLSKHLQKMSSHHLNTLSENKELFRSRSYELHNIDTLKESSPVFDFPSFDLEEEDEEEEKEEEKEEEEDEEEEEEEEKLESTTNKIKIFQTSKFLFSKLQQKKISNQRGQPQLSDKTLQFMNSMINLNVLEDIDTEINKLMEKQDFDIMEVPKFIGILKHTVQNGVQKVLKETEDIEMQIVVETLYFLSISLFTDDSSPLCLLSEKYENIQKIVDSSIQLLSSPSLKESLKQSILTIVYRALYNILRNIFAYFSKKKM